MKHLLLVAALVVGFATPAQADDSKPAKHAAVKKTMLRLEVKPDSVIYVDGAAKGKKSGVELEVRPGAHIVRFVHESGDEHENQIIVKKGETAVYKWAFDYGAPPTPVEE